MKTLRTLFKQDKEKFVVEMSGSRAVWKEVLAVYSVKTTTDPDNPQEVATMDETKKGLLTDIFWEMNEVTTVTGISWRRKLPLERYEIPYNKRYNILLQDRIFLIACFAHGEMI